MRVSVRTLSAEILPACLRQGDSPYAYEVTSYDGAVTYFSTGVEAAAYATVLHRQHCELLGMENDREF